MGRKYKGEKPTVALAELKIDYMAPDELYPNDYNPNRQSTHDFELLCKSIDEDGFTQPVVALRDVVDEEGRHRIVDGEHRWRAAGALGLAEIPVVLVTMSEAQARVATLRHNRARGEEDVALAAALLKGLVAMGEDVQAHVQDSLNMDDVELASFVDAVDDPEGYSLDEIDAMVAGGDDAIRAAVEAEGGHVEEGETPAAQDAIRARERRLKAAKDEQEREQIKRESSTYRLRLIFTDEEADVVRRVLGKSPIKALVAIAQGVRDGMSEREAWKSHREAQESAA